MCSFTGQWIQGGDEYCAFAEAARRAAVIRPGWGPGNTRWSHQRAWRACGAVRTSLTLQGMSSAVSKISCPPVPQLLLDQVPAAISSVCPMSSRIGISEKGSATVKLSVSTVPGHSSMPPRESSIGILAAAVKRWEKVVGSNLVLCLMRPKLWNVIFSD